MRHKNSIQFRQFLGNQTTHFPKLWSIKILCKRMWFSKSKKKTDFHSFWVSKASRGTRRNQNMTEICDLLLQCLFCANFPFLLRRAEGKKIWKFQYRGKFVFSFIYFYEKCCRMCLSVIQNLKLLLLYFFLRVWNWNCDDKLSIYC